MGYDIHICTTPSWLDAAAHPLPSDRWESVVSSDPELRVSADDYVEVRCSAGGTIRSPAVLWSQHESVAFWFVGGEVTVKNPDDRTIVKALELAERLGCVVVGDEGETYRLSPSPPGWRVATP